LIFTEELVGRVPVPALRVWNAGWTWPTTSRLTQTAAAVGVSLIPLWERLPSRDRGRDWRLYRSNRATDNSMASAPATITRSAVTRVAASISFTMDRCRASSVRSGIWGREDIRFTAAAASSSSIPVFPDQLFTALAHPGHALARVPMRRDGSPFPYRQDPRDWLTPAGDRQFTLNRGKTI